MAGAVRGSFWKPVLEGQWVRAPWTEALALALGPKVAPGGSVLTSTSGGEARRAAPSGNVWGAGEGGQGAPAFTAMPHPGSHVLGHAHHSL